MWRIRTIPFPFPLEVSFEVKIQFQPEKMYTYLLGKRNENQYVELWVDNCIDILRLWLCE